jgi:hypothetical protein
VGEKLGILQEDVGFLAEESTTQLAQVDEALTAAASESLAAIQEKFSQVSGEIVTSAEELTTAVAGIGEAGVDECDHMTDKFGEIIEHSSQGIEVVQDITPILEEVEKELG